MLIIMMVSIFGIGSAFFARVWWYFVIIVLVAFSRLRLWRRWRLKLIPKLDHAEWQHEGLRAKVVVTFFGELSLHLHKVLSESVLVSNDLNTGALRNTLVGLDTVQDVGSDGEIEPANVKVLKLRSSVVLIGVAAIHLLIGIHV